MDKENSSELRWWIKEGSVLKSHLYGLSVDFQGGCDSLKACYTKMVQSPSLFQLRPTGSESPFQHDYQVD